MISRFMQDLIEEANGLLILKTGDGFTEEELQVLYTEMEIEHLQEIVNNLKRAEVLDLIITTGDE
jgi:uncharacterized membrane-anchored protein YitT (DUF2179 family)